MLKLNRTSAKKLLVIFFAVLGNFYMYL